MFFLISNSNKSNEPRLLKGSSLAFLKVFGVPHTLIIYTFLLASLYIGMWELIMSGYRGQIIKNKFNGLKYRSRSRFFLSEFGRSGIRL